MRVSAAFPSPYLKASDLQGRRIPVLVRQVLGAVSEFEKATTVAKLASARKRKRDAGVKVEGRKSHAELRPEVVTLTRQLARKRPKGGKRSLREIAAELEAQGHLNERGKRYAAKSIASMLAS
jgi:DNA invertase Pin-like site-specific DNA recombinase